MPWTAAWLEEYARRTGKPWIPSRKLSLYERQKGCCPWCGERMSCHKMSIEHIIPKSLGGTHDLVNLAVAHRKCNSARMSDVTIMPVDRPEFDFIRVRLIAYQQVGAEALRKAEAVLKYQSALDTRLRHG